MTRLAEQCTLITHEIQELKKQGDTNFWRLGACLAEVADGKLHVDCGYDTFAQYLERAVDIERRQAYKWMAVATNFTEALAQEFGLERCNAYLAYTLATPEDDRPADIGRATISCVGTDGRTLARPVRECSVAQIDAAARNVRANGVPAWPRDVKALVDRLQAAMPPSVRVGV